MSAAPIPDPAQINEHRAHLSVGHTITSDSAHSIGSAAAGARWQGRTASRVQSNLADVVRQLHAVTAELDGVMGQLGRHAHWCEGQRTELYGLEKRIRQWAVANPTGTSATSGHPDASILGSMPVRYSPDWRVTAQRLRRAGAIF